MFHRRPTEFEKTHLVLCISKTGGIDATTNNIMIQIIIMKCQTYKHPATEDKSYDYAANGLT